MMRELRSRTVGSQQGTPSVPRRSENEDNVNEEQNQTLEPEVNIVNESANEEIQGEGSVISVQTNGTEPANSEVDLPIEELELRLEALIEHNTQLEQEREQRTQSRREHVLKALEKEKNRFYQLREEPVAPKENVTAQGVGADGQQVSRPVFTETVRPEDMFTKFMEAVNKNSAGPKPTVLKQSPPKFDGDAENAVLWLKEYQIIANINHWTNVEMSQYLPTALIGTAKDWYHGVFDSTIPDWEDFKKQFLDAFIPMGYLHERKSRFYSLKQQTNEKPLDYLNKLMLLRAQIEPKPTEEEVVECVKNGVYGNYASAILKVDTLSELRMILGRLTTINENREQYKNRAQARRSENRTQKTEDVQESRRPREFEPTCFNCGKTKHYARDCPEPKNNNTYKQTYMDLLHARNPPTAISSKQVGLRNSQNYGKRQNRFSPYKFQNKNEQKNRRASSSTGDIGEGAMEHTQHREGPDQASSNLVRSPNKCVADLHECPLENILIEQKGVKALLATGGSFSLIAMDLVIELKLKVKPKNIPISGVSDICTQALGYVENVNIEYLDRVVSMPLVVVSSLEPQLLLGVDFLRGLKLNFDFKKGYNISCPIRYKEPTHLDYKSDTEDETGFIMREPYPIRKVTDIERQLLRAANPEDRVYYNHRTKRAYLKKMIYQEKKKEKRRTRLQNKKAVVRELKSNSPVLNPQAQMFRPKNITRTEPEVEVKDMKVTDECIKCLNCGQTGHRSENCIGQYGQSRQNRETTPYLEATIEDQDKEYFEDTCMQPSVLAFTHLVQEAIQEARKQEAQEQEKANQSFVNKKRIPISFNVGDKVLLEKWKKSKSGKLKQRYIGPYIVLKKLSPLTYRLAKAMGSYKSAVVNIERMMAFNQRAEMPSDLEEISTIMSSTSTESEDTDTEVHWEDDPDPVPVHFYERARRTVRRPRAIRDFMFCRKYRKH